MALIYHMPSIAWQRITVNDRKLPPYRQVLYRAGTDLALRETEALHQNDDGNEQDALNAGTFDN